MWEEGVQSTWIFSGKDMKNLFSQEAQALRMKRHLSILFVKFIFITWDDGKSRLLERRRVSCTLSKESYDVGLAMSSCSAGCFL